MALTEEEVLALKEGAQADMLVAGVVGWRVNRPSLSLVTAFQIEDIAKEAGMAQDYAKNLKKIVKDDDEEGLPNDWLIAHATPLQRSKAFLLLHVTE